MKITVAKYSGFCFGVRRALNMALQTAQTRNPVYMLGDIVHNEDVVSKIKKAGIKKIKQLRKGKNKTLLIRAHGAAIKTFAQAKKRGYKIIDGTCSMVKEIHKIVGGMEQKGYKIIVIGDKKHDEVQGIIGQLAHKAIVMENLKQMPLKALSRIKKAACVAQSTQNLDNVLKIVALLKQNIKELKFFNTICRPTRMKQEEMKTISQNNELVIIIGSKTSANTKRLYEISKALNKSTHWVRSKKDLKLYWFKEIKKVGIMAGASTPDTTTQDVIHKIYNFASTCNN